MLPPGLAGEVPKTDASRSSAPPPPPLPPRPPPPLDPLTDKSCMDVDCEEGGRVCMHVVRKEGDVKAGRMEGKGFACLPNRRPPWLLLRGGQRLLLLLLPKLLSVRGGVCVWMLE